MRKSKSRSKPRVKKSKSPRKEPEAGLAVHSSRAQLVEGQLNS